MVEPQISPEVERLFLNGRFDIGWWAANGFGIYLHDKQIEVLEELDKNEATYYVLWWANRTGKTMPVIIWHLHGIFYKYELPTPTNEREKDLWVQEDYRTLHAAPTNGLVSKHWMYAQEIIKGTHPSQRDKNGKRREAPLGAMFTTGVESIGGAGEHLVVKSLMGGTIDMYSTEGNATRIESLAWRRGSWDEWPLQEAADKATAIRTVFNRLSNRLSDYDGKLVLTGTMTDETEHIAKDWIEYCEDPANPDWWGSSASRYDNPYASVKAMALAERTMDEEDYKRTVLGQAGGVRGRLFPSYMVEPAFTRDIPRFTPPHPEDGATFEETQPASWTAPRRRTDEPEILRPRGRFRPRGQSPYTYLHLWDLAIAVADNVGQVWRLPADFEFSVAKPIIGVKRVVIPGSRTLTSAEIIHTIEETYLPYGGLIVLDATDAHGKNIARELRKAGYPVEEFVFNERDGRRVIRKDAAIIATRELLTEGMDVLRDSAGEQMTDADGVPMFNRDTPYGAVRLPRDWTRTRDQVAVLRVDDDKQRKDEAMVVLMGCHTAYKLRRSRTRRAAPQRLAVFAGGRRYGRTK